MLITPLGLPIHPYAVLARGTVGARTRACSAVRARGTVGARTRAGSAVLARGTVGTRSVSIESRFVLASGACAKRISNHRVKLGEGDGAEASEQRAEPPARSESEESTKVRGTL